MFNGFHDGMGVGGWVLMAVRWVMVLALIAWVVARLWPARSGTEKDAGEASADGPRGILDRRLARGEIDAETYEELREKLGSGSPARTG